jgi:hypothetical protein
MGDHWLWDTKELNPQEYFNETTLSSFGESIWLLKSSIIRNYCIFCLKGQFYTWVGDLVCLGQKFIMMLPRRLNWDPNHKEHQPQPLSNFPKIAIAWNKLTPDIDWWAPKGL